MATLTAEQQTRIRRKLDIADGSQTPFTDAQFDDMYTEAGGDFDTALVLALRDLLMVASKFNDYTVGQTSEKKAQIFDHLTKMLSYYEDVVVGGKQQVSVVAVRVVPYRPHAKPYNADDFLTRLNRRRYGGY